MEYYKSVVARDPKIAMIFHSWDKDPGEMRTFISKYRIPFPAFRHGILKTNRASIPTVAPHIKQQLPYVIMIDRAGKAVVPEDSNMDAIKRFFAAQKEGE